MKRFVVIGLGSFGKSVAQRLSENGCRVTAIDADRERVEEMQDIVYEAVIGDATDRETLETLDLPGADAVVISLGADITNSLLATLHARELHARRMIVKGVTQEHKSILEYLGVERVVFPKSEVGQMLADRLTWSNLIDFLKIDPEYGVEELSVPDSLAGKALKDSGLREEYGVHVLSVKDQRTGKFYLLPKPNFVFHSQQIIVLIGKSEELKRVREI
jgi:trk system potassium uptake protein TrkA